MSAATVGSDLADRVAQVLEAGKVLAHQHRDYCGMGLRYADGKFIYGEVNDGLLPSDHEVKHWQAGGDIERRSFSSRLAFVEWLASQSNESLSGANLTQEWLRNNQRLTVERLEAFAGGALGA